MRPTPQSNASFEDISRAIWQHTYERDWHNSPARGLAISIALEANELLEHYQWQEPPVGSKDEIAEELADILIYAFGFAHVNDIDIPAAITAKLEKAAKKYPADKFKGKDGEDRKRAWREAKMNHQKQGL